MRATIGEMLREALEREKLKTPEQMQMALEDTYWGISKEDAVRVRAGMTALLDANTKAERDQVGRDYRRLHAELKKKYKKSGGR